LVSATVTVNGNATYRKNDYFQHALTVANSGGPVAQSATVVASLNGTNATPGTGYMLASQAQETFQYDADGNLASDSLWSYTWDAENRLLAMESKLASLPGTNLAKRVEFTYDWQGRRIRKLVKNSSLQVTSDTRFFYDGWNLVAELNSDLSLKTSYAWGSDLSGTWQGAGGVGGLLFLTVAGESYFPAYDGNGNLMALCKGSDATWAAQYEYGPFGELIRATGPMAKANPFRFSTKYQDDETDLLYYGERYYSASTGRWNSREPLNALTGAEARYQLLRSCGQKEAAARSMADDAGEDPEYTFVRNSPVALYDLLGLCIPLPGAGPGTYHGNVIKHRFGAPASSLTFRVCCPQPTQFLAWYGLTSPLPPPPPSLHGNTFPGSFTEVSLSGGDAGDQRCYTIVLNVPSTYSLFEQTFIQSIRVVGGCCCDRTFPIPRSDPTPLPVRPPPSQGAPVWDPL
jgi:RHS repeat-associated protein